VAADSANRTSGLPTTSSGAATGTWTTVVGLVGSAIVGAGTYPLAVPAWAASAGCQMTFEPMATM